MSETIIISLGGSLIVPGEIDVGFLKKFRKLILRQVKKGKRFIIIVGGGKVCRKYQAAAMKIVDVDAEDLDWLGIHTTRLNAHLLRTIFRDLAYPRVVKNPTEKLKAREPVIIASGWKPGCSTDYDAVLLAKNLGVKIIVNMTNIDYVHTKDPKKFRNAKPIKEISWKDFRKIVGDKWDPGLNAPFDPVASREAEKLCLKVIILNGKNLKNLENFFVGKNFRGTIIGLP